MIAGRRAPPGSPRTSGIGTPAMVQASEEDRLRELEERFDPEVRFRPMARLAALLVGGALVVLSVFHTYTAGFGLLEETLHRGIHLSFVLALVFLVFPARAADARPHRGTLMRPGGIPLYDWIIAALVVVAVMHIPWIFQDLAFRVGNPEPIDVALGTVLILALLEGTRRAMGWPLVIVAIAFIAYALFGRSIPGLLVHPGADWKQLVNHLYLTSQGIYGVPLGVVATYVFHFVLFGVLATRIGLGKVFLDTAMWVAGRYTGGPAKVSIFGSALFGTISGSSVANTVTVGSLTIPSMIRLGYPRVFAGAVEATASTGGQITPPIMGAAAFLMVEFLTVPYTTIIMAAALPAFMHFFGVLTQVHFEAKKLGLRGLTREELPDLREVYARGWPTVIPLVILLTVLFSGYTPYYAAFCGIVSCVAVGLLNPRQRISLRDLWVAFEDGAKYALAVGVAAATVGIVIGVVTLTGVGFKLSFVVTQTAAQVAGLIGAFVPEWLMTPASLTLMFTLVLTGLVCIVMGCGIPTTANYIIMATIAAPILGLLGVEPLVAHFFVFYYGVLADITPPVALAAYAAAGLSGADPFKTGTMAFRLGLGKALVPFVFVFAPSLLLMNKDFTWFEFAVGFSGCAIGIVALSCAFTGFFLTLMSRWERWLAGFAAMLFVAPSLSASAAGAVMLAPVLVRQIAAWRRAQASPAAAA
jgi:TRAP transporter 4TM/12TM fusion protein